MNITLAILPGSADNLTQNGTMFDQLAHIVGGEQAELVGRPREAGAYEQKMDSGT